MCNGSTRQGMSNYTEHYSNDILNTATVRRLLYKSDCIPALLKLLQPDGMSNGYLGVDNCCIHGSRGTVNTG